MTKDPTYDLGSVRSRLAGWSFSSAETNPYLPTPEEAMALEQLVDRISITGVVACLAGICDGKAEHVNDNWQDRRLALAWRKMAKRFEKLVDYGILQNLT